MIGPRFVAPPNDGGVDSPDGVEVWGTVTLTKRLAWGQPDSEAQEAVKGDSEGDDEELKYEEAAAERDYDDGIQPDLGDADLQSDDEQVDREYPYVDDQPQGDAEAVDFPPYGEDPFDPRVDHRYFRHSRDDEWADQPASDEFDPDGEFEADGEDEPLRL
jgi:hypothetical protein